MQRALARGQAPGLPDELAGQPENANSPVVAVQRKRQGGHAAMLGETAPEFALHDFVPRSAPPRWAMYTMYVHPFPDGGYTRASTPTGLHGLEAASAGTARGRP